MAEAGVDTGIARAAAAFTARRQKLGIKLRELQKQKVISASSLINFEKGRSWPREKTLAMLEEVVQWPAGTITAIRAGAPVPRADPASALSADEDRSPLVELVDVALTTIDTARRGLPDVADARFPVAAGTVLADLRQLEAIAGRALRQTDGSPAVVVALARIRRRYRELMVCAAGTPAAPLGQRLYASRTAADLSAAEVAAALGVPAEMVSAIEAGAPPRGDVADRVGSLIAELAAAD